MVNELLILRDKLTEKKSLIFAVLTPSNQNPMKMITQY